MRKKNKSVGSTLWRIHDLLWFKARRCLIS